MITTVKTKTTTTSQTTTTTTTTTDCSHGKEGVEGGQLHFYGFFSTAAAAFIGIEIQK